MFGFPKIETHKDFQFKRNFLKSVVFQVKYNSNDYVLEKIGDIEKCLIGEFPNKKQIRQVGMGSTMEGDNTPILQPHQRTDEGFHFSTKTNDKIVAFTKDALTLTIVGKAYQNFSFLLSEIEKIKPLFDLCKIEEFNRIAIRKSNFIEYLPNSEGAEKANPLDILPQMLNNALVPTSPANKYQKEGVSKMLFQNFHYTLNLQYGVMRTSEEPLVNALFLDLDLFSSEQNVKRERLDEIVEKINREMFNAFSWAITDNLVNVLNNS